MTRVSNFKRDQIWPDSSETLNKSTLLHLFTGLLTLLQQQRHRQQDLTAVFPLQLFPDRRRAKSSESDLLTHISVMTVGTVKLLLHSKQTVC